MSNRLPNASLRGALVLLLISVAGCVSTMSDAAPRNIILFIGDGMGVSQVTAGKIAKGTLHMERLKVVGLHTTHSASSFVTAR